MVGVVFAFTRARKSSANKEIGDGYAETARDGTNTPRLAGWVAVSGERYHIHANRARKSAAETHFTALGMSGMDTPMGRTHDASILSSREATQLAWFPRIVGQCCDDLH